MMLRYLAASNTLKGTGDPCVARDQRKLRGMVIRYGCHHIYVICDAEAGREWRKYSPSSSPSCPWISCNASSWLNQTKNHMGNGAHRRQSVQTSCSGYRCRERWVCSVSERANTVTIYLNECSSLRRAISNAQIYRDRQVRTREDGTIGVKNS